MDIAEESVLISDKVIELEYDRAKEIKEFDETKAGVKGLIMAFLTLFKYQLLIWKVSLVKEGM
ncbi:hypothetical protein FRX31_021273 [Thalictrum thalictroides]|uniref:Uncharacterized protein n=1 Tax=Thalictrum thalictroides TaxID=46969 RepID=A0A7J6VVM3_THATH|nr:hypothetical protein FRX31_021273 [Thalictrum thalictroides]